MQKTTLSSKIVLYEHARWSAPINALIIVAFFSDSLCSARQGKGVSEREVSERIELTLCTLYYLKLSIVAGVSVCIPL